MEPIGGHDAAAIEVFAQTRAVLGEIRRVKALAKRPVKAVIERHSAPAFRHSGAGVNGSPGRPRIHVWRSEKSMSRS